LPSRKSSSIACSRGVGASPAREPSSIPVEAHAAEAAAMVRANVIETTRPSVVGIGLV